MKFCVRSDLFSLKTSLSPSPWYCIGLMYLVTVKPHMGPYYGPEKGLLSPKGPKIVCYVYFFFSTLGWMEKSIETNKVRIEIRNHHLYVNWWCSYWHLNEINGYLLQTVITERVQLIRKIECGAGSIKKFYFGELHGKMLKNLFFSSRGLIFVKFGP